MSPPKFVRHQPYDKTTTTRSSSSTSLYSKNTGISKKKLDDFVDFIESPILDTGRLPVSNLDQVVPDDLSLDPLAPLVETIVRAADGRKAEDIRALRVSKLTATTSFLIVVSGNSRPQNQALAAAVKDAVEEYDDRRSCRGNGVAEGTADSGWILLDYGDVMVHVMTPKSRLFYDIEGKWSDGEDMDLTEWLVPNSSVMAMEEEEKNNSDSDSGGPIGGGMANLDKEEDPFWS